ncbi:ABC transporter substrate-binding protein [Micropruina sonneratiae]|uniref:ABC transporter substrate-binding protein n=1 Tax=Micropruina sonneratiae TaxID=2986940 RepID=UPI002225F9CC|nr:ABC transporter substrate-binding protein [Micropruina sp. KQZ13P-5]MCW3158699.1 ABC transporter substrate-binding protein [Micropruina sp. KQZ13P-5]
MTRRITGFAALAMAGALALTACSGRIQTNQNQPGPTDGNTAGTDAMIEQVTLPAEVAENVGGLVNFNPFSPNALTKTYFYEPLMIRNSLNCTMTPWLATEYKWEGPDKLTFTVREGVTWSDGQPLTPDDVKFSLDIGKDFPALDTAGVWNDTFGKHATDVAVNGNNVTITFSGNAAAKFDSIIAVKVLPKHIWEKIDDPVKYIDKEPVGTGPFTLASYNGRKLVLDRRADYWQADKIKVEKLVLEGNYDATQAALKLNAGGLDAYWGEIPNPQVAFVDKNPTLNHFWYAPAGTTVLTPNLTKAPFNDVKFREAYSQGINKDEISTKATYGIMKPASQTGLKLPYAEDLMPDDLKTDTVLPFDTAKAEQLLDAAGYAVGADGMRTNPDGSPLKIKFTVQAGWIDYESTVEVIVRNLKSMKLDASTVKSAPDNVDAQKKSGEFDMVLEYLHGGCEVARNIGSKLASDQIPTKTKVQSNVQRWNDPATDATVAALSGSTDPGEQKKLVGELVNTMITQFPVTSLIYAPARMIYRTDKAVGWPSEEDPYATNSDMLVIMTHLRSAK